MRRTLQLAAAAVLAAVLGAMASLALVTPSPADPGIAKNPFATSNAPKICAPNGDILVRFDLVAFFPITVTEVTSVPVGYLFDPLPTIVANGARVWQAVPNGTTESGITFAWIAPDGPITAGNSAGFTSDFPACTPSASAEFTRGCDGLIDVMLHNDAAQARVFDVNGVEHQVAANASATVDNVDPAGGVTVNIVLPGEDIDFTLPLAQYDPAHPTGCGKLPVTGASVSSVAGIGGGLLAAGALLVVFSLHLRRRRRTT
jgi:hypothetical protein